jgi:type I restriction enzyme S subunit
LDEQSAVAAAIDERLKVLAKVLSSVEACLRNLEGLYHVILTKAFLGELVPQDPSDEPASVLLESIRELRAKERDEEGAKARQAAARTKWHREKD